MVNQDLASRHELLARMEQGRRVQVEEYYQKRYEESTLLKRSLAAGQAERDAENAIVEETKALESRAEEATQSLLGVLGEYKKKNEELQNDKREMKRSLGDEKAKVPQLQAEKAASEDLVKSLTAELGSYKRKASEELKRKDEECDERCTRIKVEMKKKRERLVAVAAAKGVVQSDLKGLGAKVGELEGALDEL